MWVVLLAKEPKPDAVVWPGRRALGFVDAVGWPLAWIVMALHLPKPAGLMGPAIITIAALAAASRAFRALYRNERYWFTTWRWGVPVAILLVAGLVLKVAIVATRG